MRSTMLLRRMSDAISRNIVYAATAAAVVLAIHAPCVADIQRRVLSTEVPFKLELASGRSEKCAVAAWSGDGLEGSCGQLRWEDLKTSSAVLVLKACVSGIDGSGAEAASGGGGDDAGTSTGTDSSGSTDPTGSKAPSPERAQAAADAAAIVLALPDPGSSARTMVEWAKRQGATPAMVEAARTEADRLRVARVERARKAENARLSAISPEAPPFATTVWIELDPAAFEQATAHNIELARTALAKAGASATLHESAHIALLAESGDPAFKNDAAKLEAFYMRWSEDFSRVRAAVKPQGKIPVIIVGDRDRWRLLVAAVAGIDPARYPDVLVVYPPDTTGTPQPLVLVAPNSDRALQAYHASVGVARAMLHWARTPERGPPWLNEGLPRVMAEIQTPMAAMDEALRRDALFAVRNGTSFDSVLQRSYSDPMWTKDFGLAQSMSYMFVRWLYEQNPDAVLRLAKAKVTLPGNPKPSVAATWEQRFEQLFGQRPSSVADAAKKWFYTND